MAGGIASGEALTGHVANAVRERVDCPQCGIDMMHRVERRGLWQKRILPLFGYYPWRCNRCGTALMLHKRKRAKITG